MFTSIKVIYALITVVKMLFHPFEISLRISDEDSYQQLPFETTQAKIIYAQLEAKGASYFVLHYREIFKDARFDFKNDHVLLNVGNNLLAEKKADLAIALYIVYTKEFPNILVARNDLGDAYLLKGEKAKAKECYRKALELSPGNERAQRMPAKLEQ